jgi:hypothetical protein
MFERAEGLGTLDFAFVLLESIGAILVKGLSGAPPYDG